MGKKSNTAVLLLALVAPGGASAPCPQELLAQAAKVAELRQIPLSWRPQCQVIPSTLLRQRLEHKLARELPVPPKLYLEALERMGFVPPTKDLYGKLLDFYVSQVLGFYEPQGDAMVIVDRANPGSQGANEVWHHEFAHAAQEKRYRLPSKLMAVSNNSDEQRALSAIAEGEAMLVMLTLASAAPLDVSTMKQMSQDIAAGAQELAQQAGIGDFFVQDLTFPYAQGLATVLAAFEEHGWSGVDALLAKPPTCTAALLFSKPCRHLEDKALPSTPRSYENLLTDTVGAWGLRFWLAQKLGWEQADSLARGWDGDRLRVVRQQGQPHQWAMVWQIRVDTLARAQEMEASLRQVGPALLANFQPGKKPEIRLASQGRHLTLLVDWPPARP